MKTKTLHPRRSPQSTAVPGMCHERQGWMAMEAAAPGVAACEALGVHDAWPGPVKLVHGPQGLRRRVEFALPADDARTADSFLGEAEREQQAALREEIVRAINEIMANPNGGGLRNLISATLVRAWLEAEGHTVAEGADCTLRLAIPAAGFDGQLRIEVCPDRLRMRMALGEWANLPGKVESAMLQLAAEANARTRLLRVVWREEGTRRQCEGQVDLTGLPWDDAVPGLERVAQHMVRLSLAGLAVAARRLGRELAVLAADAELAEVVAAGPWCEALF